MAGEAAPDLLAVRTREVRESIPLLEAMDVRVVELGSGHAAVEAPLEANRNHVGMMYAGALFSLAEVLGGLIPAATWDCDGYVPIVAGMEISFVRPATSTIRASARLSPSEVVRVAAELGERADRVWFSVDAEVLGEAGAVASTSGRYLLQRLGDATR